MADLDEPIELLGDNDPIDFGDDDTDMGPSKIQTFGTKERHADKWVRKPNVTGHGAVHCKVFHAKLREDALEYLDEQINTWLDEHPEFEVKQVTSSVGDLKQKTGSEPALFITVWV